MLLWEQLYVMLFIALIAFVPLYVHCEMYLHKGRIELQFVINLIKIASQDSLIS